MREKTWLTKMVLGILLVLSMVFIPGMTMKALAADCISINGGNEGNQNYIYGRWSAPVCSYLTFNDNQTLMKVQAADGYEGVLVEYYDMNYQLLHNKVIPQELPIFGGFYETATNYYIVTGQKNKAEDSSVEVFRITKYDKSWNRIASAGLKDCNTTVPFRAGSLRFAECGKWLLIRTSHEMYQSSDGKNHQANVTMQVDTEAMVVTASSTTVSYLGTGYVSHSFNQFIGIEDNQIVALDHGDAYPRSLVLIKYPKDVTYGDYRTGSCEGTTVMEFPGAIGDNDTGATVGGFEIASDYYLVAGSSVVQDAQNTSRTTRNIFVSAVSKSDSSVTTRWFTDYAEGEETVSAPHMVKLSNSEYLLLWTREENVYYVKIDATGKQTGSIYSMKGSLSDCKPILADGKIIWYVWKDETITFYQIRTSNLSETAASQFITGHHYENEGLSDGYANMQCTLCGDTRRVKVAEDIYIWWSIGEGHYSFEVDLDRNVNDNWEYQFALTSCDDLAYGYEMENSNPDVITVEKTSDSSGMLTANKVGTATISIWPKYNPEAKKTFTFKVYGEGVKPITSIYLDSYAFLELGESKQLSLTIYPEDATNQKVSYESSDNAVATVSDSGLVTAIGAGKAVITVTAQDGSERKASCTIIVTDSGNTGNGNTGNGGTDSGNTGSGNTGNGSTDSGNTGSGNTGNGSTDSGNTGSGNTGNGSMDSGNTDNGSIPQNGWYTAADGSKYWYEDGIRQGTEGRGKEIYDIASDAWYWLDGPTGKMAADKDVYQESLAGSWGDYTGEDGERYGKWVRYDENGHMIKGWQMNENGTYFFDYTYGTMAKGYATIDGIEYYFNPSTGILERTIGKVPEYGWKTIDGNDYWYEDYVRQGYSVDASYRGKEIYDDGSDAWYWLDNVDGGKKATGKDVYQESLAGDWGDTWGADGERYGKWVRYDEKGHMIKGWQNNGNGTYFFDYTYGTMAKGNVTIDGQSYYFDENTGVLK